MLHVFLLVRAENVFTAVKSLGRRNVCTGTRRGKRERERGGGVREGGRERKWGRGGVCSSMGTRMRMRNAFD